MLHGGIVASGVVDTGWYRDRIGNVEVAYVHGVMTEACSVTLTPSVS
jgi:hypothetical protein